jgi:hypothetical protein
MFKKCLFVVTFDVIFAYVFLVCFYYLFGPTDWFNGEGFSLPAFIYLIVGAPFFVLVAYTGLFYFVTLIPALWFSREKLLRTRMFLRVLAYVVWAMWWLGLIVAAEADGLRAVSKEYFFATLWTIVSQGPLFINLLAFSGFLSTFFSEPTWGQVVKRRAANAGENGSS